MSVDVHCGTYIRVSEQFLHILWCCTVGEQIACECVSQHMKMEIFKSFQFLFCRPCHNTNRPKDKVCVTGSDSFRKRVNRVLSRSRERNPKAGTDNHDIGNQHRRATCLAVLHIYQSIRKHPARFFSSCRVFSYAIQTQQKPESFLRIAFLFWVEFVNETNSSISKQVRPLNSTRMSFAFNINSITFSSCL